MNDFLMGRSVPEFTHRSVRAPCAFDIMYYILDIRN